MLLLVGCVGGVGVFSVFSIFAAAVLSERTLFNSSHGVADVVFSMPTFLLLWFSWAVSSSFLEIGFVCICNVSVYMACICMCALDVCWCINVCVACGPNANIRIFFFPSVLFFLSLMPFLCAHIATVKDKISLILRRFFVHDGRDLSLHRSKEIRRHFYTVCSRFAREKCNIRSILCGTKLLNRYAQSKSYSSLLHLFFAFPVI